MKHKLSYLQWVALRVTRCVVALTMVVAPLYVWCPKCITLWGKLNHAMRLWGQDLAAHLTLPPGPLSGYEWYRWGQSQFDDVVQRFLKQLPPNQRDHMEAVLYGGPYWLNMAVQAVLIYILMSWILRRLWEHRKARKEEVAQAPEPQPTVHERVEPSFEMPTRAVWEDTPKRLDGVALEDLRATAEPPRLPKGSPNIPWPNIKPGGQVRSLPRAGNIEAPRGGKVRPLHDPKTRNDKGPQDTS